jgi:hypothetical protein
MEALARFRAATSRLIIARFDSHQPVYTSSLGQTPNADEFAATLVEVKSRRRGPPGYVQYILGTDAEAQSQLEDLVAAPDSEKAWGLELYLQKIPHQLYEGFLTGPERFLRSRAVTGLINHPSSSGALRFLIAQASAGLPKRQTMLRDMLTPERRAHIEAAIGRPLQLWPKP